MARSLTTTDHETIRSWVEQRGGKPAQVASTAQGDDVGIIRIDFPGFSGEGKLEEISWDDWFEKFDASNLALVYEEETADGQRSNFNKLVGRETAQKRAEGVKSNRRALRSGSGKGGKAKGSRQAARAEAARTTRSRRSGAEPTARRGSTSTRKSTAGRKRAAAGARSASARSSSGARASAGGAARKGASKARSSRKSR